VTVPVVFAVLVSGCGSAPAGLRDVESPAPAERRAPAARPSTTLDEAFRLSHASAVPPGLSRAGDSDLVPALLAGEVDLSRPLVPGWLPAGYGLAAPYASVGDGSALPNPLVWRGGYRVAYTDGDGLVVLQVGSGRLPGEGKWRRSPQLWRGSALVARGAAGSSVVATNGRRPRVAVAVAGLSDAVALRVLRGLRTLR
jgi:hypothetical protein